MTTASPLPRPTAQPECPALAAPGATLREWSFAERYPALAQALHGQPALHRQIAAHYDQIVAFCEQHVAPHVLEYERRVAADPGYVPDELLQAACRARLFSSPFPRWLGGAGQHFLAAVITCEVVATHCVGIANLLGVSGLALGSVLATFDPRALHVLARLVCERERRGLPTFLSTCVTEPGAGSDAEDPDEFEHARLTTLATPCAGGYRLRGTKVFISNGALAQLHVVMAYTHTAHRPQDMVLLLVPSDAPGVTAARNEHKMGQMICPATEMVFEDVFVPQHMVCRTRDHEQFAYTGLANVLGLTRAGVGAFATGVAEGAYRATVTAVQAGMGPGLLAGQEQWVQLEIAQLARRAQLARAGWVDALLAVCHSGMLKPLASMGDAGLPEQLAHTMAVQRVRQLALEHPLTDAFFKWRSASQSERERDVATAMGDAIKVSASDLALENCLSAISLVGKNALRHDLGLEKRLRDAKLLQIYEGTNQINMLDFLKRRVRRQFEHV